MRWLRRLIVVFVVGLLGLYPLLAPVPHRIDKAHYDLIKTGMTKDEAESIFGAPPGDYDFAEQRRWKLYPVALATTRMRTHVQFTSVGPRSVTVWEPSFRPIEWSSWIGRHGAFAVSFDRQGRVHSTSGPSEVRFVPPWQRWWKKLTD